MWVWTSELKSEWDSIGTRKVELKICPSFSNNIKITPVVEQAQANKPLRNWINQCLKSAEFLKTFIFETKFNNLWGNIISQLSLWNIPMSKLEPISTITPNKRHDYPNQTLKMETVSNPFALRSSNIFHTNYNKNKPLLSKWCYIVADPNPYCR